MEKLGINIEKNINEIEDQLVKINFCFMFAQSHHNAMKYVGKVRKELSTRTIFNLIGPLLNPAGSKKQLLGVYDKKWIKTHTEVLKYFGSEHVLVVNGFNGLDEISLSGNTYISELKSNKIYEYIFNPQDIGYSLIKIDKIKGGDADYNAKEIRKMFNGENIDFQRIVELNAGAIFYLSGKAKNIKEGAEMVNKYIVEGKAKSYLESLKNFNS